MQAVAGMVELNFQLTVIMLVDSEHRVIERIARKHGSEAWAWMKKTYRIKKTACKIRNAEGQELTIQMELKIT